MTNTVNTEVQQSSLQSPQPEFIEILRSERRDLLDRLRKTQFSTLRSEYLHGQVIPYASYSPWMNDVGFRAIYEKIQSYTLVDIYRCYELFSLARQMESIEGDIVEVGVWRGGTAALLSSATPGKKIHLFDTFKGVVKADAKVDTLYSGGEHSDTSKHLVAELFQQLNLHCKLHEGIFPEDTIAELPEKIAVAHIDVDTYASAKESFEAIWPRVSCSGMVIFDDYGFFGCEGVTQAVHEINAENSDSLLIHNLNGHALVVKKNV